MLRCNRSKISFIVEDLEVALRIEAHKEKTTGVRRPFIFAVLDCESPNHAFTSMYGRVVPFLDDDRPFARGVIRYALPIFRLQRQYLARRQSANQLEIWSTSQPTLSFTRDENRRGLDLQGRVLSDNHSAFVCIGIAEPVYYHIKHNSKKTIETDLDLYSCMPSWENYIACTRELEDHAVKSVRVGQHVLKNISEIAESSIIDYANEMRTEFGDAWLLANCKFVIAGGGTGNYWMSSALNKPALLTDTYGISNTSYGKTDLAIPQLAWSISEKVLMPFSWLIAQGEGWGHKKSLIYGDIEIVKNSAEEITEAVLEMNQRIDGTWVETSEDIELQARFRELREAVPHWQVQQSVRIGAAFLRRYKHLL